MGRASWYAKGIRTLGLLPLVRLQLQKRFGSEQQPLKLTARHLRYPVYMRPGASDLRVFYQIFFDREYRCVDDLANVNLILDCGANVGYSSAYFLSKYPDCFVVAVEPDPSNFAMLERNLAPYKNRTVLVRAAVWPRKEPLQLDKTQGARGHEWARFVEPRDNENSEIVEVVDIPWLIARSPYKRVSLLKIDIEGSEHELFTCDPDKWLGLIDNIVIELHGETAKASFLNAIKERKFAISTCDELTVGLQTN